MFIVYVYIDDILQVDKTIKKQAKRDKQERQQQEMLRLQEVLKLQTFLDSLGDDTARENLRSGKHTSLVSNDLPFITPDSCADDPRM